MSIMTKGRPRQHLHLDQLTDEIKNGKKNVKFSMNIPAKIHKQFSIKTTVQGIDMKDVLMEAIHKYLSKSK